MNRAMVATEIALWYEYGPFDIGSLSNAEYAYIVRRIRVELKPGRNYLKPQLGYGRGFPLFVLGKVVLCKVVEDQG